MQRSISCCCWSSSCCITLSSCVASMASCRCQNSKLRYHVKRIFSWATQWECRRINITVGCKCRSGLCRVSTCEGVSMCYVNKKWSTTWIHRPWTRLNHRASQMFLPEWIIARLRSATPVLRQYVCQFSKLNETINYLQDAEHRHQALVGHVEWSVEMLRIDFRINLQ